MRRSLGKMPPPCDHSRIRTGLQIRVRGIKALLPTHRNVGKGADEEQDK